MQSLLEVENQGLSPEEWKITCVRFATYWSVKLKLTDTISLI
jgi:hypothetical protein